MASLPEGSPAPADGMLPPQAAEGLNARTFGVYWHVPYCRVRCGYCDFNTYTASEVRGASRDGYLEDSLRELALAGRVREALGDARPASSVFFGGGTPTLLPATELAAALGAIRDRFGLAPGAEVTTEANPDSVDERYLATLVDAGFTRVSFGVQSVVPHVLRTLDRTHNPDRVPEVVRAAQRTGLAVSIDLIYGTPGETMHDWRRSVDAALELDPGHLSAYSLIVEEGTALARRIRRGELPDVDDDLQADMYEVADAAFSAAGYEWYETSNWARPGLHSRHNLAYWTGQDWWGIGPGAHSHVGGVRWWNVKHPAAYRERLLPGASPALAREVLTQEGMRAEGILLLSRLRRGLPLEMLDAEQSQSVTELIADGLVQQEAALAGRLVPTLRGRLLGDRITAALLA